MPSERARTLASLCLAALLALLAGLAPLSSSSADPPPTSHRTTARSRARATRTRATRARATRARATRARPRTTRRRVVPRITAAQRRQIRRWHVRAPRAEIEVWSRRDPQPIVFRPIASRDRFELVPATDGTFDAEALDRAELAFAYREDGSHRPVHPRLLQLVHRAVRHFRAPYVYVISGYRSGNPRSRHAQGRAIDLVLPGVPDRRLAAYLRPQGFVGVGIYPTSGFVHLDVRARSYFWSDASGPGQRNRERRILRTLGPRFDRIARNLGAEPVPDLEDTEDDELEESLDESVAQSIDEGDVEGAPDHTHEDPAPAPDAGDASDAGPIEAGADAGVSPPADASTR